MNWALYLFAAVVGMLFMAVLFEALWPRDEEGEFMSPEEVSNWLSQFPPDYSITRLLTVKLVLIVASVILGIQSLWEDSKENRNV